jgi:hypothetical protein
MQSPQKLQARLHDLLGPPGPDSDPLELVLRTVVATTAPMLEGVIDQYTPEQLDAGLEDIALYFLQIRSDSAELTAAFVEELGKMNVAALQEAETIAGDATEAAGELPAPAADTSATPADSTPGPEGPAEAADDPAPADAPAPAPVPDPTSPGSSPASSGASTSPDTNEAPAGSPPSSSTASTPSTEAHNPAPPWG